MKRLFIVSACLLSLISAPAADWPQYRGPNGDGTTNDKILTTWPANGPKEVWKHKIGDGVGSIAAVGGQCFTLALKDKNEVCIAFDIASGKTLWETDLGPTTFNKAGGIGPRTTPSVVGDLVYTYGTYLMLTCMSAKDGKIVWQHDIQAKNKGQTDTKGISNWGNAQSPIVEGDVVMVAGGGDGQTFLFFDRKTGKLLGKDGSEKITHATPTPTEINGQRQVIFFTQAGLTTFDPQGKKLWHADFSWSTSTAASPIVEGDTVYCSAGYGTGAGAFKISTSGNAWKATELWRKKGELENHWSTPVVRGGHVYGLFGFKQYKTMPIKCVELATGKIVWSEDGFGQGGTIIVGDNILIQGDQGQLVLIKATADKYTELARAQILTGDCWNNPAVANGYVISRSKNQIVCLDLRVK